MIWGHREADQFAVGEVGSVSTAGAGWHDVVIDQHVECRQEGVQLVGHNIDLGHPPPVSVTRPLHMIFTASII